MKKRIDIAIASLYFNRVLLILILSLVGVSCQKEAQELAKKASDMVITEYVYSKPETFSEFGEVLKVTGIENLLRVRGPFTLMLPTNDAMFAYYKRMNVNSFNEIEISDLEALVYNHIFKGEIGAAAIPLGTLPFKNGLGDNVASDFQGIDIVLNKTAKIIKKDISVSNGYVHHIDYVLELITKNVFEVLAADGGYEIFEQGLIRTGLSDTLKVISFPYGNIEARANYTILAVPDTLFQREGINSIDDLIEKYSDSDDLKNINNGFHQYMEYHCISEVNYFSNFTSGEKGDIYYLISNDSYINIIVGATDFKINEDIEGNYTGFYFNQSNIPAKNGVLHTINTLLPKTEIEPADVVFQVTDYFDFQQGPYYGNYYQRFYDGQNTFEKIKWEGEFLLYYFKNEDAFWDADGLNISGHFWIEITTPKIMKGKYKFSTYWFGGAVLAWYIDGEYFAQTDMKENVWLSATEVGDLEFTETKEHKIMVKTLSAGGLWWDRIIFNPL